MTLKSAVVGGGAVSDRHLATLDRHADVDLRAVCDADERTAGDRASTYDIRAYGDFEGMLALESLDWVHVCTPPAVHFEQARLALEDDLALQIEGPLTVRESAAEELAGMVDRQDAPVSVAHDGVFEPAIQRAERLIEEGAIGTLRAVDLLSTGAPWPHEIGEREWLADLSGGAFEAGLSRPISQVLWLGGYPASRTAIDARGARRGATDDRFDFDSATFQYTTADGVCCNGTVVASDDPRRVVRVHGDRGSLVADLRAGTVTVGDRCGEDSLPGVVRDTVDGFVDRLRAAWDGGSPSAWSALDGDDTVPGNTAEAQIDAEATALARNRSLPVPLASGLWTVRVIETIRSAARDEEPTITVAPVIDAA